MFVWSKLSADKWADAWEERFVGEHRAVITQIAGKKTIRVEVYCEKSKEAAEIKKLFGGSVRELKTQNWAAMLPEVPPPVKVRDKLIIVAEKDPAKIAKIREENPGRELVSIPPDMAFGTGHHATTATVLRMLVDFVATKKDKPWSMLDLGTGSGVLAIAASKFGADPVWGCDYDALAVKVARDNVRKNKTPNVEMAEADVLTWKPTRKWDLVVANLFSDILAQAFPIIVKAARRDGVILISGILKSQAAECLAAGEKSGIHFEETVTRGKWVTARGRLR